MLTKIMYPDTGTIEMNGRISSLLELGAGFHPDLSGRENIYITASTFGLTKKEIDKRIQDIIDFSELWDFIDNPVRTYSSGMYMRLAFSVAINVDADILLIDEILAVGDLNFQTKCINKLMEIKASGTTIVLVSHSTDQIESICDRSIWIHEGVVRAQGETQVVNREYVNYMRSLRNQALEEEQARKNEESAGTAGEGTEASSESVSENESVNAPGEETGEEQQPEPEAQDKIIVKSAVITNASGESQSLFTLGESVTLEIELYAEELVKDYLIELNLVRADVLFCYGVSTSCDRIACEEWQGDRKLKITFPQMNLLKGLYHFDLHIANSDGSTIVFKGGIAQFEIEMDTPERGLVFLPHEWK